MIFVRLATGRGTSSRIPSSTCPVSRSSRTALPAVSFGVRSDGTGVASAVGNGDGEPCGGTGVGGGVETGAGTVAARTLEATRAHRATATETEATLRTRVRSLRVLHVLPELRAEHGLLQLPRGLGEVGQGVGGGPARVRVPLAEHRHDDGLEQGGFALREVPVHREVARLDPIAAEVLHD